MESSWHQGRQAGLIFLPDTVQQPRLQRGPVPFGDAPRGTPGRGRLVEIDQSKDGGSRCMQLPWD